MKKNLRKGRKEMKKLEKKLLDSETKSLGATRLEAKPLYPILSRGDREKGLIDVDSTHTIVEDGVIKVHKARYGSCEQCGCNCQKSHELCYKCRRKKQRREKALQKLSLLK